MQLKSLETHYCDQGPCSLYWRHSRPSGRVLNQINCFEKLRSISNDEGKRKGGNQQIGNIKMAWLSVFLPYLLLTYSFSNKSIRGMSFRVYFVKFCEGFITKFGDEFSKSPNLVNNTSLNLVTNLWLTESGEIFITKFGDEFVAHRILWLNWWISFWQTYHAFRWWLLWKILRCF